MPLSWLYGAGIWVRNKLFDLKILPSKQFDVPVISVGNITVGGTGKTPHIEYLAMLFEGVRKTAVVSRGYKRKTRGFVLAGENSTSLTVGDEPCQISRKFPDVTVAVDSNRCRAIKRLLALPDDRRPEVILLDDAFQHRYVKPSLSILLEDYNRPVSEDCLLPAGRLREPAENAKRADIKIITKCPADLDYASQPDSANCFYTKIRYYALERALPDENPVLCYCLNDLKNNDFSVMMIAGLANPEPLKKCLLEYTNDFHSMIYPDHYEYKDRDLFDIMDKFLAINNKKKIIITTEKDVVRLKNNRFTEYLSFFIYTIPIDIEFLNDAMEDKFIKIIDEHVEKFKRNSRLA